MIVSSKRKVGDSTWRVREETLDLGNLGGGVDVNMTKIHCIQNCQRNDTILYYFLKVPRCFQYLASVENCLSKQSCVLNEKFCTPSFQPMEGHGKCGFPI